MRDFESVVYFAAADGRMKIGITSMGVEARLAAISHSLPHPLQLIGTIDGEFKLERAIHKHFAAHRLKGEWFRDCPELRASVDVIIKHGPEAAGIERPRLPVGLVLGDLTARSAAERDENIARMIKTIWPEDSAREMAGYLGLSPRLCQAFIDQDASPPRVIRMALFAAFMVWVKDRKSPVRYSSNAITFALCADGRQRPV